MTNMMTQHEGHLAWHEDRLSSLPCVLTTDNARIDGAGAYRGGSFVCADGAFEIPYGPRDLVLLWGRHMHAATPPIPACGRCRPGSIPPMCSACEFPVVPTRMSYVHYTKRGRDKPNVWDVWHFERGESEGAYVVRRRAALFGA
jgi:hypothetical protein